LTALTRWNRWPCRLAEFLERADALKPLAVLTPPIALNLLKRASLIH